MQSLLDSNYTPGEYTVSYNINTGKINITSSTKYFKITYTQKETIDEFVSHVPSFTYNTELYSFNEKILNKSSNGFVQSYESGYVLLSSHIHNIYISSDNLSNFQTLDLNGRRNIIKKVCVNAPMNSLIVDNLTSPYDYIDVSRRSFNVIHLKLTDSYGTTIDLQGGEWSCTVLFQPIPN